MDKRVLKLGYITRLKLAVLTRRDLEGNRLTFLKRPETFHLNLGIVDEQVFATLLRNEAITLFGVEPFNRSLRHPTTHFLLRKQCARTSSRIL